jgi:sugar phosphate isomerase/epimerase
MAEFKYSVFTAMLPELGIEEAAELVGKAGYDGIEWRLGVAHVRHPNDAPGAFAKGAQGNFTYWEYVKEEIPYEKVVEYAPRLKKAAAANGLKIPNVTTYIKMTQTPGIEKLVEQLFQAAQILEVPSFRVQAPNWNRTFDYKELYYGTLKELDGFEKMSRRYGIRLNMEIHADCITSSAGLAYQIARNFDPKCIGVIYDPGNMIREGMENWRIGLQLLGPYLAHVHIKNAGWFKKEQTPDKAIWERPWVPLNEGLADLQLVLSDLVYVGYPEKSGWLSLEDFSVQPTEAKVVNDLKYLKHLASLV